MKLTPVALAGDLERRLAPLYVLAGDEPLLADECLALLRAAAEKRGTTERDSHVVDRSFDWDGLVAGLQNLSLFAANRFVQLRLPTGKPGDAGARCLAALAAQPPPDTTLVVVLPAPDAAMRRAAWFTALAGAALWVDLRSPGRGELPDWLRRRLARHELTADEDALEALASRVEGNLLAAQQEIDKLALLLPRGQLTAEAVRDVVSDGARFDVFELADAALAGDIPRAVRVLGALEREGVAATLVLWSLVREVLGLADVLTRMEQGRNATQAIADAGVWRSRQELYRRAVRGRHESAAGRLLHVTARADQIVKGARTGDPWRALLEVTLALANAPVAAVETA